MNYLAHCYLSCSDEDILLGNIITDFMQRKERADYSGLILKGIELHRQIDSFTDAHPSSRSLRKLLRKRHDKYAPVVVDLIWDYCLSINWKSYSGSDLTSFTETIYEVLNRRRHELPNKFNIRLDNMIEADFLMAYANKKRMQSSLMWMDKRVNFPSRFSEATLDYDENESEIQALFSEFFPAIINHVEFNCLCD